MNRTHCLRNCALAVLWLLPVQICADDAIRRGPLSAEQSLHALQLPARWRAQVVAAEPLVVDPIAIDFAADGGLWVVEYRDYPEGVDGQYTAGGAVKYLRDTDGDGQFDESHVFLDKLPFPTGVMQWRKGILVAAAPDILYAEDTDGDHRADLTRVLFTGFDTENYQARVNGFRLGLDNWVYGSSGHRGGVVQNKLRAESVEIGKRDFRFRPDQGDLQAVAGGSQHGRVRDDWGNWFGNDNSNLLYHYPLAEHYVRRNPYLDRWPNDVFVPTRQYDPHQLYPISQQPERFNQPDHLNRVTSACSPEIYRDSSLSLELYGDALVCEPVHNVVTRLDLQADGVTFRGQRAAGEQQSEFVASYDNWFRPVQVRTGPDGAVWIVDMYRLVIEHPRWISPERLAQLDVRAGADRGRIYRIFPEGARLKPYQNLQVLDGRELAGILESPNGTLRDLAQRLLLHRSDEQAIEQLEQLARGSSLSAVRGQALATLDGLGALTGPVLQSALVDPDPHVRQQALRLSETRLAEDEQLAEAVLTLVADDEVIVRYQLALCLGQRSDARAGRALAKLAARDADKPLLAAAILSSAVAHLNPLLDELQQGTHHRHWSPGYVSQLVYLAAQTGDDASLEKLIHLVQTYPNMERLAGGRWQALTAMIEGLQKRASTGAGQAHQKTANALERQLQAAVVAARQAADDPQRPLEERISAVGMLGKFKEIREADVEVLRQLLSPQQPTSLQMAAVDAIAAEPADLTPQQLLAVWPTYSPLLKAHVLETLLRRPAWCLALLHAVRNGDVALLELDAARQARLLEHQHVEVRELANQVLADVTNRDRQSVVANYQAADMSAGNVERGEQVFLKSCATCHVYGSQGHELGPNLETLTDRSTTALLIGILDPNRAVEAKYLAYTVATSDGRLLTGRLTDEAVGSITLLSPDGKAETIARTDLEELATAGKSLMPEGLEKDLSPQAMTDLIAYLQKGAQSN